MTAMQPRTPEEAARLGLIMPNIPRGLFGGARRRFLMSDGRNDARVGYSGRDIPPSQNLVTAADMQGQASSRDPLSEQSMMEGAKGAAQSHAMVGSVMPQQPPGMFAAALQTNKADMPSALSFRGGKGDGSKGIDWRMIAGIVGDGLSGMVGGQPLYAMSMMKQRQQRAEHQARMEQMQEEARLRMSQPDYATINNRRVRIDPVTGQSQVLYQAPQEFEDYAATLGAEPGTPEYDRLVQDYVLRGSGPTATDNYNLREEWRQDNRLELEGERQGNREALLGQRQAGQRALKATPTYRQANPVPPRSGGRSSGRAGGIREGQTATNPQTGAKVVYRDGKWIPVR